MASQSCNPQLGLSFHAIDISISKCPPTIVGGWRYLDTVPGILRKDSQTACFFHVISEFPFLFPKPTLNFDAEFESELCFFQFSLLVP